MSPEQAGQPQFDELEKTVRGAISPAPAVPNPEDVLQLRAQVEAARANRPSRRSAPRPTRVGHRGRTRRAVLGLAAAALVLIGGAAGALSLIHI